jgi:hypothetical protein
MLVGGLAVNLLGAMRSTADMDILVEMSDENLQSVMEVFKKQGYKIKQPLDLITIANRAIREKLIKDKHLKAVNFFKDNELKEVDIIIDSAVSFQQARKSVVWIRIDDLKLPVISIDNLIKMKKNAGRMVDKLDIDQLKKIKRLKKQL